MKRRRSEPRVGRPVVDPIIIVQAAGLYRHELRTGRPPAPRKKVAEVLGVSKSQASKYIARARAEGLLPETEPGIPKA